MDAIIEKIKIDFHSLTPIYQQIIEQIQQLIITEQIKGGEHLPSVRHLGFQLNVSPNTVARSYLELEREQIVMTKRGGGTIVSPSKDAQVLRGIRQKHLYANVDKDIIRMLSQGYEPEELEAAFYTSLERWREEKSLAGINLGAPIPEMHTENMLRIIGSHDIALNILAAMLKQRAKATKIELTHIGSLQGLIALGERKADIAGIHLLDEETGEYNLPFIKRILPGQKVAVLNLVFRQQGLMYFSGNPKNIKDIASLCNTDVRFINRQKGSGTRILLDMQLKTLGISDQSISGYDVEVDNHLAVGLAIAQGKADTGLGIEAAARSCGLDFLPLFKERYDLVIPMDVYQNPSIIPLLRIVASDEFKRIVHEVDGYDTSQTGTITLTD